MIPTIFGIIVLSFIVIKLAPGDPTAARFGGATAAGAGLDAQRGTEQAITQFRERYGFDEPLYVQFWMFLKRLATLDLTFFVQERPVMRELLPAILVSVQINAIVFVLTYLIAVPLGILSAAYPRTLWDHATTVGLFLLYSLPSFWVAELLRMWLGNWFPIMGLQSEGYEQMSRGERFLDYLHHVTLPVFCLTYGGLAYLSRQMRVGMLEVIRQDYIRTAEAKGAGKARVVLVHALRNGLFPVITLFASLLPFLIGGSIIIEYIFNIPGMGLFAYQNVLLREYDAVMATLILSAVLTLLGILISDILYVLVNPQVSLEGRR
jgi:peptide/nickel transport system permease protein